MPIVQIEIIKRDLEKKRTLARRLTDVVVETLGCPEEAVAVIIREMEEENYARGGVLRCDEMKLHPAAAGGEK